MNNDQQMYAGVDIGGTTMKYGVVSEDGTIVYHKVVHTDAQRGKEAMIADIQSIIIEILTLYPTVVSIGIGFPAVVNPRDGCVYYPANLPGWDIVPLTNILQQCSSVPIAIDNDANVAALAESELGSGKDSSHFLYVTLGTGVGGGIIINNRIFSGEQGGAGEIGHSVIDIHDEPTADMIANNRLFRAGTLEERLGRVGIIETAKSLLIHYPHSFLHQFGDSLDVEHISLGIEHNDEAAIRCFEQSGHWLGLGLASILAILDMRMIIVGGGISQAHPLLLDTVRKTLQMRSLPTIARYVEVRTAFFSNNAGVVGAAMLAKQKYLCV